MAGRLLGVVLALAAAVQPPASAAQPAASAPATIPIEAFAEPPFIADPLLSPDGKRIAARIYADGNEQLAIYDLTLPADAPPTFVPLGPIQLRWFSWAGPDRLLVGHTYTIFALSAYGFAIYPATRLKRYQVSDKSLIDIGSGTGLLGDDVIFTDPWGRFILLSAQKDADDSPSVERIDLATGKGVEVQKKMRDIWSWFADGDGHVRAGISYDGDGYAIYYRTEPNGELRRAAKGRVAPGESVIDTIRLFPGSSRGVMLTNAATGRFGAYEYELGQAGIGAPIYEHPEVDLDAIVFAADGSRIEGVRYTDDRARVKWLVPELEQLQAQIDRTFRGKVNRIVNRSSDGNIVLVWSGGADDAGTYYVFDRKAKRMNRFASPYDRLVDASLAPVRAVRYTARDGLQIPAYLTLPPGRVPKNLPLIVMPHGGPFLRDSYSFDPWVQYLASRGYAVLQPNFRGSTGYGRAFVEKGYGQWGTGMQDDLDDGRAWLAAEGIADPKRVCMMGASYGGYAALWAAVRNPDLYRCAISFAGVTDVRAILKYDGRMLMAPRYSKLWRRKVRGEEKRDLAAISPLQQAAKIAIPVLIAHGEKDTNVPVDQATKLIAALAKRKAVHEAAIYKEAGHGFSRGADARDFLTRVDAFLRKHNPPD
jgi:dipeptidyl aminopeptidase/acylaminoacyl peptidase